MNRIHLLGRVGSDAEVKHTQSGQAVASWSVATSAKWRGKDGQQQERTEWHRCQMWGERAEKVAPYIRKGDLLCVEGEMRYRQWEDKDGGKRTSAEVHVTDLHFASSKRDDGGGKQRGGQSSGGYGSGGGYGGRQSSGGSSGATDGSGGDDYTTDDIPF